MYRLEDDEVLYEGCHLPLSDGSPCELGKFARKEFSQWNPDRVGENARICQGHVYCPIGKGRRMFNFVVMVNDIHLNVF